MIFCINRKGKDFPNVARPISNIVDATPGPDNNYSMLDFVDHLHRNKVQEKAISTEKHPLTELIIIQVEHLTRKKGT